MVRKIPAEYWFSLGRVIAYCHRRLRWVAAPGHKLEYGRKVHVIDGQSFPVRTVRVVEGAEHG